MKVLFIVPYPTEGASNRYRVEQYLPYLRQNNIEYTLSPFMSKEFYRLKYQKGRLPLKLYHFILSSLRRLRDIFRARNADIVFIHIEAFPFGLPVFEWLIFKMGKPMIFDFEDAIYLPPNGNHGFLYKKLKYPAKFYHILKMCGHVIVCNEYLKEKLQNFNNNISIIPTSIDLDKFILKEFSTNNKKIVLGWIGSPSTFPYLLNLGDIFHELAKTHQFVLKIIGGGARLEIAGVEVINQKWNLETEMEDFRNLDIGLYPLPDDEWGRAKTPFKTVQYMSVGVPVVASNITGNKDIIKDGENGFLANSKEEWLGKLSLLIKNPELRKRMGTLGRKTIEGRFSLKANASKFLDILNKTKSKKEL